MKFTKQLHTYEKSNRRRFTTQNINRIDYSIKDDAIKEKQRKYGSIMKTIPEEDEVSQSKVELSNLSLTINEEDLCDQSEIIQI